MDSPVKRNGFAGGLGFILAAAGSAVGLGNLWSFPYKTSQNGGAAFVFVYIFSVIIFGLVVMIAEIHIGKRAQANSVSAYKKINSKLGWMGILSILAPFFVVCYYVVLGGYTVKFTMNSFADNSEVLSEFSGNIGEVILYSAIIMILSIVVVTGGVKNGIEKACKVLMPVLFIIMIAIVIYCMFLGKGVAEGLKYYLNPDFSALGFKGILAAMSQAFFSLSVGMGIMISYGSYTGKNVNVFKSAIWIAVFDTLVALLAGLAIFPTIYHYQAETGISLQNNGIVLLFSSLPIVFKSLGDIGKIISFFFFGMVSIAALTSIISMLEVATQFIIQRYSMKRKNAIKIVGGIGFAISIPIGISLGYALTGKEGMTVAGNNLLDVFDIAVSNIIIPICAIGACLTLGWFTYKSAKKKDVLSCKLLSNSLESEGLKLGKIGVLYTFILKYIAPLFISFIEVVGIIDIVFPKTEGVRKFSSNGLTIVLIALAVIIISIVVYFIFLKNKETGTNEDEIRIEQAKESTVNEE